MRLVLPPVVPDVAIEVVFWSVAAPVVRWVFWNVPVALELLKDPATEAVETWVPCGE